MTALTTDDRSQDTIRTMLGGRFKFGIDLPRHYRESVEVTITRHRDLQALIVEQSCDVSILKWFEKSSSVNTYWSDSLSSFLGWRRLPSLSEDGMRKPVSSLRDSGNVGQALTLYTTLQHLDPPFSERARRVQLACITFQVTQIRSCQDDAA